MKHRVLVNDRPSEVDFAQLAANLAAVEVEPGVYSILAGRRVYEARVIQTRAGKSVQVGSASFEIVIEDPRSLSRFGPNAAGEGRRSVNSPMPGKVIRILVNPGDSVEAGQGLVVVEAMKMQNEMKSPKAGTVVQVLTTAGATVVAGEPLIIVE